MKQIPDDLEIYVEYYRVNDEDLASMPSPSDTNARQAVSTKRNNTVRLSSYGWCILTHARLVVVVVAVVLMMHALYAGPVVVTNAD